MASPDLTLQFPLTNQQSRLLFEYDTGSADITLMYDSGAQIPVWCTGDDVLLSAFPDAIQTGWHCQISGFGRDAEQGAVYLIPEFRLSENAIVYAIKNLLLVSLMRPMIGCDLLLSETMFSKADFMIVRRGKRMLQIDFDNIGRPFQCSAMRKKTDLQGITVWTQIDIE